MTVNPYAAFTTDPGLEVNGVTIDYGPFRVTGARAGGSNKRFAKVLEKKTKPHRRQVQTETLNDAVAERIIHEAFIEGVIINWECDENYGKKGEDDKPLEPKWVKGVHDPETFQIVPMSPEVLMRTFKLKPDLFTDLRQEFAKMSLFQAEEAEADAGN